MKLKSWITAAGVAAVGVAMWAPQAPVQAKDSAGHTMIPAGDWRTINRDLAATRFSPLKQINTNNVANLKEAWSYTIKAFSEAAPLAVDGVMYVPGGKEIVALDGATGKVKWTYTITKDPHPGKGRRSSTFSNRGVGYWPGDADHDPRIIVMAGSRMIAIDAKTGMSATGFGQDGEIDVGVPYTGTPTIYKNVAIIGAAVGEVPEGARGNPRAFDMLTGKKLWEFQTVPEKGQPFNDTWGNGWKNRSGTNMWAFAAPVDVERGIAYLPISGPAANYWGGDRPGNNVYSDSIVAVNAETGKYLWHFQLVHHDLWDSDMPNGGALVPVMKDGRTHPGIAEVNKTSNLFILNRTDGKPIIPVTEKPVPKGDVPREWYSPTQPFPATPPLSRVSFKKSDMVTAKDTNPAHAAACEALWEKSGGFYNAGPYTPFNYHKKGTPPKSTIQLPGGTGGVNWGGIAVDPTTGYIFANAQDTSLVGWVEDKDPNVTYSFEAVGSKQPYDRASVDGKGPFHSFSAPLSGKYGKNGRPVGPVAPCYKPPWGQLVAVNANTGKIAWKSILGLNEALPKGKQLVGNSSNAGPSVTAGGLVFVGATNDHRFRAFDANTGKELWEAKVQGNANANPISYTGKDGKQYVAVIATNRVMVYSLP
ncbi:MAG TPA: PQQ-binding-like beta-propeller repeat protein [Alphaproteobacteria bacterium]|nr:PQQ-binding-like beta-propeller repeat protein [Alphaproteobacteria bacterium]